jgi:cytochrome c peroxidase
MAKISLGRKLFFDPRLSENGRLSCHGCHDLKRFGADGRMVSLGHRGQPGRRNAPTVYNSAGFLAQFWDGRSPDVEDQSKRPILNPVEMPMPDASAVVRTLAGIRGHGRRRRPRFRVPGLRNVAETAPYYHDGSIAALDEAVRNMATHQLGISIDTADLDAILAFMDALTGEPPAGYIAKPELPPGGEKPVAPAEEADEAQR